VGGVGGGGGIEDVKRDAVRGWERRLMRGKEGAAHCVAEFLDGGPNFHEIE
jgi:hypothetical protein